MRIVNIRNATPPYVYFGRFLKAIKDKDDPTLLSAPFKGSKDDTAAMRQYLNDKIKSRDQKIIKDLMMIDDTWTIGCWCVDLDGDKIFSSLEVCHAQILFKAAKYVQSVKDSLVASV